MERNELSEKEIRDFYRMMALENEKQRDELRPIHNNESNPFIKKQIDQIYLSAGTWKG